MTDLERLNIDAARYRWLRENYVVVDWSAFYDCDDDDAIDKFIDAELAGDE